MSAPDPIAPTPDRDVQDIVTPIRGRHSTALVPVVDPKPGIFGVIGDRRPAIWTEQLPALNGVWNYGKQGQYTGPKGALRVAGKAYALFVVAFFTGLYGLMWVVLRPSRLIVALVLGALSILTIYAL